MRYHPLNGSIIILLFIFFEVLYFPCLCSIYKHMEHSCYKFLFFIGIADMLMMFIQGLETGVFNFTGEMFCPNDKFNYITACFAGALFALESSANFFLALDRCADSLSPKISKFFFDGKRVLIWMFFSISLSIYYLFYVNPGIYDGVNMNWFINPFQSYPTVKVDINDYINPMTIYYDTFLTFGFPAFYLLFIFLFLFRLKEVRAISNVSQRSWKISMFFQISIIIGLNISCTLLFSIMQYLPIGQALILFGYYTNYFVFGLPPVIYLIFNKTIRTDCRIMLGSIFFFLAFKLDKRQSVANNIRSTTRVNPMPNQISCVRSYPNLTIKH
uniref:Uncharacterized protein n=1 Tax=Meloidogyne enterolobii TaxID=390850 RepID=A0A6V7UBW2_MELEN|nr:unnamed protein product [Meloidogyne enterolobii]